MQNNKKIKSISWRTDRRTALTLPDSALIQLHSISLITTLACDAEALASGDPNSPARARFDWNRGQQPSLLQSDKFYFR